MDDGQVAKREDRIRRTVVRKYGELIDCILSRIDLVDETCSRFGEMALLYKKMVHLLMVQEETYIQARLAIPPIQALSTRTYEPSSDPQTFVFYHVPKAVFFFKQLSC